MSAPERAAGSDTPTLAAEIAQRLAELERLHPRVIDLSLGRIQRLLAALDHPERRLPPVVHIAGTNGKGSVLALLRACLEAAALRVHSYTSPHLVRFNERINLAGADIGNRQLVALIDRVEAANAGQEITFFEITTAIAYLAFAETPADWLLLETGLGGRLDATNVINRPALSVITPVSLDHQSYLGDTVPAIAGEKAGIIKPGVPAVIASQTPDARDVLTAAATRAGAPAYVAGEDWTVTSTDSGFHYQGQRWSLDLPMPSLPGAHQVGNAATAVACLETLDLPEVTERHLRTGLRAAAWPGRLQQITDGPVARLLPADWTLWVDGGHNEAAARALADWAAARQPPVWLLVSMLANRDASAFLKPFAGKVAGVAGLPGPAGHDGHTPEDIVAAAAALGIDAFGAATWKDGLARLARKQKEPATVLVTGSLYFVGSVLAANGPQAGSPV